MYIPILASAALLADELSVSLSLCLSPSLSYSHTIPLSLSLSLSHAPPATHEASPPPTMQYMYTSIQYMKYVTVLGAS